MPGEEKEKESKRRSRKKCVPEIWFYRSNEVPYGVFSNLYRSPIEFEGKLYSTAEHAYQAGKARKPEVRDWILSAPALAAMAAHGLYTWDVTPNWSDIKFDRMRRVLRAKFEQHAELRNILLRSGDARIVEVGTVSNAVNRVWGEVNGVGQNMLGIMLMELRAEFSNCAKAGAQRNNKVSRGIPSINDASIRRRADGHPTTIR